MQIMQKIQGNYNQKFLQGVQKREDKKMRKIGRQEVFSAFLSSQFPGFSTSQLPSFPLAAGDK